MHHQRHSIITRVRLKSAVVEKLKPEGSNYRVMLYCAADDPLRQYTRLEVAFPRDVELKVNQDVVKANFRGLKNKPGSTRPVDITSHLRKLENYENTVTFAYALTDKVTISIPL